MGVMNCVRCFNSPCICLLPASAPMDAHIRASAARSAADSALLACPTLPTHTELLQVARLQEELINAWYVHEKVCPEIHEVEEALRRLSGWKKLRRLDCG